MYNKNRKRENKNSMEKINERVCELITAKQIKKTQFAKELGISQPYVSELCKGTKSPSDRTIRDICRLYDVNETWLRTGEGQMFVAKSREQEIGEFFADVVKDQGFKKNFVNMLARMTAEEWALMERKMREVLEETP
jgi:transcriptional regulator with XRE-family HTH domain|nr:MAG TPA: helix-turn-helix domain protein [Caudoviricetes sp.]